LQWVAVGILQVMLSENGSSLLTVGLEQAHSKNTTGNRKSRVSCDHPVAEFTLATGESCGCQDIFLPGGAGRFAKALSGGSPVPRNGLGDTAKSCLTKIWSIIFLALYRVVCG
jgi:hypothetical protein